jgi:hypothetical protein
MPNGVLRCPEQRTHSLVFSASNPAVVRTALASAAFVSALFLACSLHYKKVVRHDVTQWPDEWWSSISQHCYLSVFLGGFPKKT